MTKWTYFMIAIQWNHLIKVNTTQLELEVNLTVNECYILELSQEIKLQSVLRQYFMFRKKVKQFSCPRHISYMIQNK